MSGRFVLTAEIQLQSPKNIGQIVQKMRNDLGAVNVQVKAQGVRQTTQEVKALKEATDKATTSTEKLARTFALSFKRFVSFSIATRFVGLFTRGLNDAVGEAIKFEREMVKVSQVSGKTLQQLKPLADEVTRLSTSLGVASESLILVSRVLTQAGFTANETKVALEALAKTELAPTFEDITKTTEGAVAIFNQFRTGAEALEAQLGSINAVAGKFAVESGDLISVVRRVGGVFRTAGGDLNELLALFTSVRSTTRESAESIATGLRTIFVRIQRPRTLKFLEELGVKLTDMNGRFIGPIKAVEQLNKAFGNLEQGDPLMIRVAEEIAGFRQIGKVLPLIQQYAVTQQALNVAKQGENSLDEDSIKAKQSLAVRITQVREEFAALVRTVYDSPIFKLMATSGLELASALIKVGQALKDIIPIMGIFATFQLTKNLGSFAGYFASDFKKARGFARGGFVPGSGNTDTIPAMLTPGEFVINKNSAQQIGYSNLSKLNQGGVQKFSKGGKPFQLPTGPTRQFSRFIESRDEGNSDYSDVKGIEDLEMIFDYMISSLGNFSKEFKEEINTVKFSNAPADIYSDYVAQGWYGPRSRASEKRRMLDVFKYDSPKNIKRDPIEDEKEVERRMQKRFGDKKKISEIAIYTPAEPNSFTAMHEIGHFVDNTISGTDLQYASESLGTFQNEVANILRPKVQRHYSFYPDKKDYGEYRAEEIEIFADLMATGNKEVRQTLVSTLNPRKGFQKLGLLLQRSPEAANTIPISLDDITKVMTGNSASLDLHGRYLEPEMRLERLGLNNGGVVPGSGNSDTVPAMLTPGEFVIKKSSVQKIGAQNLQKLNKGGEVSADYFLNEPLRYINSEGKEVKNGIQGLSTLQGNIKRNKNWQGHDRSYLDYNIVEVDPSKSKNTELRERYLNAKWAGNKDNKGYAFEEMVEELKFKETGPLTKNNDFLDFRYGEAKSDKNYGNVLTGERYATILSKTLNSKYNTFRKSLTPELDVFSASTKPITVYIDYLRTLSKEKVQGVFDGTYKKGQRTKKAEVQKFGKGGVVHEALNPDEFAALTITGGDDLKYGKPRSSGGFRGIKLSSTAAKSIMAGSRKNKADDIDLKNKDHYLRGPFPIYSLSAKDKSLEDTSHNIFEGAAKAGLDASLEFIGKSEIPTLLNTLPLKTIADNNKFKMQQFYDSALPSLKGYILEGSIGTLTGNELKGKKEALELDKYKADFDFESVDAASLRSLYNIKAGIGTLHGVEAKSDKDTATKNGNYVNKIAKSMYLQSRIVNTDDPKDISNTIDLRQASVAAQNAGFVKELNALIPRTYGRKSSDDGYFVPRAKALEKPGKGPLSYAQLVELVEQKSDYPETPNYEATYSEHDPRTRKPIKYEDTWDLGKFLALFEKYGIKFSGGGKVKGVHSLPGFKPKLVSRKTSAGNAGRKKQTALQLGEFLRKKKETEGLTEEEELILKRATDRVAGWEKSRNPRFADAFWSGRFAEVLAKLGVDFKNSGGTINGVGDTDTVPAMLTPGEFVIKKEAAQRIGVKKLHELNDGKVQGYHKGGFVQHFNTGGMVGGMGGMGFGGQLAIMGVLSTFTSSLSSAVDETSEFGKIMNAINSLIIGFGAKYMIFNQLMEKGNKKQKELVDKNDKNIAKRRSVKSQIDAELKPTSSREKALQSISRHNDTINNEKSKLNKIASTVAGIDKMIATKESQVANSPQDEQPLLKRGIQRLQSQRDSLTSSRGPIGRAKYNIDRSEVKKANALKFVSRQYELQKRSMDPSLNLTRGEKFQQKFGKSLSKVTGVVQKFGGIVLFAVEAIKAWTEYMSNQAEKRAEKALKNEDFATFESEKRTAAGYQRGTNILAAGGTGAMIGAGIGSFVPVIGTAIGAAVGGVIGTAAGIYQNSKARDYEGELEIQSQILESVVSNAGQALRDLSSGVVDASKYIKQSTNRINAGFKAAEEQASIRIDEKAYKDAGFWTGERFGMRMGQMFGSAETEEEKRAKVNENFENLDSGIQNELTRNVSNIAKASVDSIEGVLGDSRISDIDKQKIVAKGMEDLNKQYENAPEYMKAVIQAEKTRASGLIELSKVTLELTKLDQQRLKATSAVNTALMNMNSTMNSLAQGTNKAAKAQELIDSSFENTGGSEQAALAIDNFMKDLTNTFGKGKLTNELGRQAGNLNKMLSGFDKVRSMDISLKGERGEDIAIIKEDIKDAFGGGAIGERLASVFADSLGDSGELDKDVISRAIESMIDPVAAETKKGSISLIAAMESRAKAEENTVKLMQESQQALLGYIAAQKTAIDLQKQAADFIESFGGRRARKGDKVAADKVNVEGSSLGFRTTGTSDDLRNLSLQARGRYAANREAKRRGGLSGQSTTVDNQMMDQEAERIKSFTQSLIDAQQAQIATIQESISILEKKNQLEKDSLQALVSGDIKAYIKQQSAVGAQAAIATGDQRLMSSFGATALGDAIENLKKLQDANVNEMYGQSIGGAGGLLERGSSAALQLRGVTDPRMGQLLAGTDVETERLNAQGRRAANNLDAMSRDQEALSRVDYEKSQQALISTQEAYIETIAKANSVTIDFTASLARASGSIVSDRSRPARFSYGGGVPGIGNSDTVPALLTPGEFVINKRAAKSIGYNQLERMNKVQKFNSGGTVGGNSMPNSSSGTVLISIDGSKLDKFTQGVDKLSAAVDKLANSEIKITGTQTVNVNVSSPELLSAIDRYSKGSINSAISDRFNKLGQELKRPNPNLDNLGAATV